jgi:hypothetical protein
MNPILLITDSDIAVVEVLTPADKRNKYNASDNHARARHVKGYHLVEFNLHRRLATPMEIGGLVKHAELNLFTHSADYGETLPLLNKRLAE